MRWRVMGESEQSYEVVVEADTEGEARAIARMAIEEGFRSDAVLSFVAEVLPLGMWTKEME